MWIWFLIAAAALAGLAASRLPRTAWLRAMGGIGILLIISEVWKQWTLTVDVYGGHYCVWYFPFQLCSLPMYLCALLPILPAKWQRRVQVFLMNFTLLGALAVFFDTSGMQYPLLALTAHSYAWHLILIFLGTWAGGLWIREKHAAPLRAFMDMLPLWLICVLIATIFNILLWPYGEISMFYISPYEPSTQIIVRDVAVLCGTHIANLLYLLAMAAGAFLLHLLWQVGDRFRPAG